MILRSWFSRRATRGGSTASSVTGESVRRRSAVGHLAVLAMAGTTLAFPASPASAVSGDNGFTLEENNYLELTTGSVSCGTDCRGWSNAPNRSYPLIQVVYDPSAAVTPCCNFPLYTYGQETAQGIERFVHAPRAAGGVGHTYTPRFTSSSSGTSGKLAVAAANLGGMYCGKTTPISVNTADPVNAGTITSTQHNRVTYSVIQWATEQAYTARDGSTVTNCAAAWKVAAHELGHVLHIGHTAYSGQVMSLPPHGNYVAGTGDKAGIACLYDTSPYSIYHPCS